MKKRLLTGLLSLTMVISAVGMLNVSAASFDKSQVKAGDVIEVAKYDAKADTYTLGTIQVVNKTVNDNNKKPVSYNVLQESSFAATGTAVSDKAKADLKLIESTVNQVLTQRKDEVNLSRFGNVDSESSPYSLTIAPYAVALLEEKGLSADKTIWLAVGNKAGKVVSVYTSINEEETEKAAVKLVTPKKMSIRLSGGSVYQSGDEFEIPVETPVKFQMCTDNWDTGIYTDDGNGLAGTVVYTVNVTKDPKGRKYDTQSKTYTIPVTDLTLRVDTNSFFMAYRFSFKGSTVGKGTQINHVVSAPVEYWSVNLPLGSTVHADAYQNSELKEQADVFIQTGANLADSYTDYTWTF